MQNRTVFQDNIKQRIQYSFSDKVWNFEPPATPHITGAREKLIRSIKVGLRHALPENQKNLLQSCLVEIEPILNSRPLTYIESIDDEHEVLTSDQFLFGILERCKTH